MFNILLYKLKKYLYNNDNKMKFNLSSRKELDMKYYINGFRETFNHFKQVGKFTEAEWTKLLSGEVIIKRENEFYIEAE